VKIVNFAAQTVTVELDPTDCFVLAEACEASVRFDQARNLALAEALAVALTAAGMAAAVTFHMGEEEQAHYTLSEIRAGWLPADDRYKPPAA
jgi:hypothetical protein